VLNELSRLSKENAELREQLARRGEDLDITEVADTLREIKILFNFSDGTSFNGSLQSFFAAIGRELTVDISANYIATIFTETLRRDHSEAISSNAVAEWLKDLSLFDLVASRRERIIGSFTESQLLWWLTPFGKKMLVRIFSSGEYLG
jgi:hypothetical protein